jgi:hypothetical protein
VDSRALLPLSYVPRFRSARGRDSNPRSRAHEAREDSRSSTAQVCPGGLEPPLSGARSRWGATPLRAGERNAAAVVVCEAGLLSYRPPKIGRARLELATPGRPPGALPRTAPLRPAAAGRATQQAGPPGLEPGPARLELAVHPLTPRACEVCPAGLEPASSAFARQRSSTELRAYEEPPAGFEPAPRPHDGRVLAVDTTEAREWRRRESNPHLLGASEVLFRLSYIPWCDMRQRHPRRGSNPQLGVSSGGRARTCISRSTVARPACWTTPERTVGMAPAGVEPAPCRSRVGSSPG